MKVVFFTNCYEPLSNGVVTAIRFFRRGLRAAGHEVYIFAPACKGWEDKEENVFRFPAVNLSRRVYYPVAIPWYPGLSAFLAELQPDIIHTHHPFVLGEVGLTFAKRMGIPLVYTFHTRYECYVHYFAPLPTDLVWRAGQKLVCNYVQQVDLVTTPSESMVEILRSYGINREIKVLPNPIDLHLYETIDRGIIRERYGLQNCRVLLYTGRLGKEKNLALLLKAFTIITRKCRQDLRLILVGSGPEETALQEQARSLGIGEKVIFPGRVDYREIPNYYGSADLFVMPSTTETFGLVVLEALASGVPVVAVNAGGSRDMVVSGYNGFLTPEDPESFAAAILELLENDERRRDFAHAARESAARYSVENITRELLALYEEVRAKKGTKLRKRGVHLGKAREG